MEKPRILFMGTPRFALPSLQVVIERAETVIGVVTQPDRPSGRGQQVVMPPVKELAMRHNLPVYQPRKVREQQFIQQVQALSPDLIVVVAFGQILPRALLDIPPRGCINVHASLLPAYRGAAPINWALINGETVTGVTIMLLDEGMDTGDILLQKPVSIRPDDTAATTHDRLAESGAALLGEALEQLRRRRMDKNCSGPCPGNLCTAHEKRGRVHCMEQKRPRDSQSGTRHESLARLLYLFPGETVKDLSYRGFAEKHAALHRGK